MATDTLLKYTTALFGTPTSDVTVPGTPPVTDETRTLTFPGTPPKVLVVTQDPTTKVATSYELDGNPWTMPRGMFFRQYLPGYVTRRNTLLTILFFLVTVLVTALFYSGAIRLPSMPTSISSWFTPTAPATTAPATATPASPTPAPAAPAATPTVNVAAPSVTINSPAVSAEEAEARLLLTEEQRENNQALNTAKLNFAAAQSAVDKKNAEWLTAKAKIVEWTEKRDEAKEDGDEDSETMAQAKIDAFKLERDLLKKQLTTLEGKLENAKKSLAALRSTNRSLLGLPLDEQAVTRATEAGTANALKSGLTDLTNAVKDNGKKTGELVTAVNGVAKSVDGVKTSVDDVAKNVKDQTAMLKNYCDRIDSFFTNFSKIYIASGEKADKVVEALNKLEKAYASAKTSGNADEMKRIADALEKYLEEKAKAPAPAAPVAPATTYVPPPQVQQGQWYAAPCQNSQCYQVRRR